MAICQSILYQILCKYYIAILQLSLKNLQYLKLIISSPRHLDVDIFKMSDAMEAAAAMLYGPFDPVEGKPEVYMYF